MPKGSIAAAASGMKTPSLGSASQDLSTAFAGVLAGIQEEERRAEEARFRQAQLDVESRRADAQQTQAEASMVSAQEGAEQGKFSRGKYDQEFDLEERGVTVQERQAGSQERQAGAMEGQVEVSRERLEQEQQQYRQNAAGARPALIREFGIDPAEVAGYSDQFTVSELQRLSDLKRAEIAAQAQNFVGRIQASSTLLPQLQNAQKIDLEERQMRLAEFEGFKEAILLRPPDQETGEAAQAILAIQDPVQADQEWMKLYAGAREQDAAALQAVRNRVDQRAAQLGQIENTLMQGAQMAPYSQGGTPSPGDGRVGGMGQRKTLGPNMLWSDLDAPARAAHINDYSNLARDMPIAFRQMLPDLQKLGVDPQIDLQPVWENAGFQDYASWAKWSMEQFMIGQSVTAGGGEGTVPLDEAAGIGRGDVADAGGPATFEQPTNPVRQEFIGLLDSRFKDGVENEQQILDFVKNAVANGFDKNELLNMIAPENPSSRFRATGSTRPRIGVRKYVQDRLPTRLGGAPTPYR